MWIVLGMLVWSEGEGLPEDGEVDAHEAVEHGDVV
jgi:hypothetical protein